MPADVSVKLVAIHQPNFFPWLGYFDKIRRADVFVVLDNVQFQKTGGTWSNRVMLNIGGKAHWVTAPVVRAFHGVRMINEVEFNEAEPWRQRLVKTLQAHYRRAPFFDEAFTLLHPLVLNSESHLSKYNVRAVTQISGHLGFAEDRFVLASTLETSQQATELLVELVRAVGGTHYLAGGGAAGYQQDEVLSRSGIGLVYQSFAHPAYAQIGSPEFIAGLSVIDALMNCGIKATASLLRQTN